MNLLASDIITLHPWQFIMWVGIGIMLISCLWLEEGEAKFNQGIKEVEND